MVAKRFLCAVALPLVALSVLAANQETVRICSRLSAQLPAKVTYPPNSNSSQTVNANLSASYVEAQSRYWDVANVDDTPACVFFPGTAQDVSLAMELLNKSPSVPFALKSGGHNFNRGFSSTNGGVLIAFRPNMNYTTIAPDKNSAEVGPGARWAEVMAVLDAHDRCAVGGRAADVGVGGYIPLGGISYLTAQYGFASDNVLNFEIVTANGTIINANKTSNPDVFFSIRGGGNLFGVVTKYTLALHPIGKIWGGMRSYSPEQFPAVFSAISNYNTNFNETKSAIVPTLVWANLNGVTAAAFNVSFFWDGEQPPAHVFADFDAIPVAADLTKVQRYPDLLGSAGIPDTITFRTSDAVSSLPNMPCEQMVDFFHLHYDQVSNSTFLNNGGFVFFNLAIQPIPVALQKASFERGPAALTTDPAGGDKWWIEYSLAWSDSIYDGTYPQELINMVHSGRDLQQLQYAGVKPTNYQSGDLDWVPYNPLFANDAQVGQPIFKSYGTETYNKMRQVHAELDPNNMLLLQTKCFQF